MREKPDRSCVTPSDEQPEGLVSAAAGGQPAQPNPQHRQEKLCRRTAFQPDFKCKESDTNKLSHILPVHLKAISNISMLNFQPCLHLTDTSPNVSTSPSRSSCEEALPQP